MKLTSLGYSPNWLKFKFLDESIFNQQLAAFTKAEELEIDSWKYRMKTLENWFATKTKISDKEIDQVLLVIHEDPDELFIGKAVEFLFQSPILSPSQFSILEQKIPEFGDWTKKLIDRTILDKRLQKLPISRQLFDACVSYKNEFNDNRLIVKIIELTDNTEFLEEFLVNGSGKRIKTMAEKKLRQIARLS